MILRDHYYEDVDGQHFPDTYLGSSLYYSLNFECWLTSENDTITQIVWKTPEEVLAENPGVTGYIASVQLTPTQVGSFRIECHLTSEEDGVPQTKVIPMVLKVF